jgi:hypothetical protein
MPYWSTRNVFEYKTLGASDLRCTPYSDRCLCALLVEIRPPHRSAQWAEKGQYCTFPFCVCPQSLLPWAGCAAGEAMPIRPRRRRLERSLSGGIVLINRSQQKNMLKTSRVTRDASEGGNLTAIGDVKSNGQFNAGSSICLSRSSGRPPTAMRSSSCPTGSRP